MEITTHRSAIDDLHEGTSTTHCGLTFDLYGDDEQISNSPTCEKCLAAMIKNNIIEE